MTRKIKIGLTLIVLFILVFAGIKKSLKTNNSLSINQIYNSKENFNSYNAGSPYLVNFALEGISDKQIWSIEQDSTGLMFFANRRGIIAFDGFKWKYIKTPSVPYKLKRDTITNTIFVGCNRGVGYLKMIDGYYKYEEIEFDIEIGEISEIVYNDQNVYFYNEEFIARVSLTDYNDKNIIPADNLKLTGIFSLNNKIYVSVKEIGFYEIKKEFLSPISFSNNKLTSEILFSIPVEQNKVLLGTNENKLLLFDGISLSEYITDAQIYLNENYLINGVLIDNQKFAVGTISGGIIVIDYNTGKSTDLINNSSGLPDNEVYSILTDNNQGLWITHIFGVSRVDFKLPVKNFGNYYGLKGNIISTNQIDSVLYVITTEGVFYLTQPKDLNELNKIQNLQKEEQKTENIESVSDVTTNVDDFSNNVLDKDIENNVNNSSDSENEEEKGFFKKWKEKRKKKDNDEEIKEEVETPENVTETSQTETLKSNVDTTINENIETSNQIVEQVENESVQNNNTVNEILSENNTNILKFNYYFKKIDGIDEKCKIIQNLDNSLIVLTNSGIYQIIDYLPKLIFEESYITSIKKSESGNSFYITGSSGIDLITYENSIWTTKKIAEYETINDNIYTLTEDNENNLWLGGEDVVYYIILDNEKNIVSTEKFDFVTDFSDKIIVKNIYNEMYFFVSDGIYYYNSENKKIENETLFTEEEMNYMKVISSQDNIIWYFKNNIWYFQDTNFALDMYQTKLLNLFDNIRDIKVDEYNNIWVVDGYKSIYKIQQTDSIDLAENNFKLFINKIYTDSLVFDLKKSLTISYENNNLFIDISAPNYIKEKSTQYQYIVEGLMQNWTDWSSEQTIPLYLKSGKYKIYLKAKNILGQTTDILEFNINVKPPFWQTSWFYLLLGIIFISLVIAFFRIRQRALFLRNKILEEKVKKRTQEILMQKEEIETQRDELKIQRDLATNQRDMITYQNKQITDSIEYASRIQNAILPLQETIGSFFSEYFIINKPRDVVSGDFYFFKQVGSKIILAVADCTGHGVPGAFLSMMGIAYLNEIVSKTDRFYANKILNSLRINVIDALHQTAEGERKDGMDIALCVFDKVTNELQFSGAYNPLIFMRNKEITEFLPNKMPIGYHRRKDESFTNNVMHFQPGDVFYLFTDGFADQFGGPFGRKFLKGNFKQLLKSVADEPLIIQQQIIIQIYNNWKGENSQIDDIMVLGIKI